MLGFPWLLRSAASLASLLQFIHRTSNQFNADYDQNVVMLRLGARL